jgi:hypothetical protein
MGKGEERSLGNSRLGESQSDEGARGSMDVVNQKPGRVEHAAARLRKLRWPFGAIAVVPYLLLSDVDGARWIYIALGLGVIAPVWTFPAIETGVRKFREGLWSEAASGDS